MSNSYAIAPAEMQLAALRLVRCGLEIVVRGGLNLDDLGGVRLRHRHVAAREDEREM
ncbi:hypothetical protein ACRAVF_24150 [Bradyrhizobium oligotrophicum S58]